MDEALNEVAGDYGEWISDLNTVPSAERAAQHESNRLIASKLLRKVLAARIVVFELFLELAIKIDKSLQEKHKRIWLLFQLSEDLNPPSITTHPFIRIMKNCLGNASFEALDTLIRRLDNIREKHLPPSKFIIGLDEAQRAIRLYPHSFISSANKEIFRSILREVATVFTSYSLKLVVSGTGVSLEELEEAMHSGVSKPAAVKLFHDLGMFDTWPKLKPFVERYVPTSVLESPSGRRLQLRIREHLLGR
jgi:hypothetical protein